MKSPLKTACVLSVMALTVFLVQQPAQALDLFNKDKKDVEQAASADSGTMDRADGDMKKVLEAFQKLGPKPIDTLTPAEARKQPTPADAVAAVLREKGKTVADVNQKLGVTTKDLNFNGQPVRVYFPEDMKKDEAYPVIVYYHGGGFVIADIDVYDGTPRSMAKLVKAIVVSPEYRHAPEHKFPASHEDAFAAYKWVLENAASWGGDPAKVAVMGESAGGNLAANVAIMARDEKVQAPVHMALIYPVAGTDMTNESYTKNENAKPLNKAMMKWFVKHALTEKDKKDPRIDLVNANLKGLPSATIITAEIDPLLSEGKLLADRLEEAGVKVDYKVYEGVTHEFFGMAAVVSDAKDAQEKAAENIKGAFKDSGKTADKAK